MTLPDTASPIEIAWTLIALVAAVFHLLMLRWAIGDRRALVAYRLNGPRKQLAAEHFRREVFSLSVQAIFVLVGVMSMTVPQAPVSPGQTTSAFWAGIGIVFAELLLAGKSMSAVLGRGRVLAEIEHAALVGPHVRRRFDD